MKHKEKRGFWASLFTPKPCGCSSQFEEIAEKQLAEEVAPAPKTEPKPEELQPLSKPEEPKCSCGGNC